VNKQVSFDNEPLILVDDQGVAIGSKPKLECHLGDGILHKAFSVFVLNRKNEILLQQRSAEKMLWPSYWSNSCCSHPRAHEASETDAVQRRLDEELGIEISDLEKHFDFEYRASYKNIGTEWEHCSVFTARSDASVQVNPREIADTKWVAIAQLSDLLEQESEQFTPWIKLEWQRLLPILQTRLT